MRIKTVMNHNQNDGLLKMIKRTDPMILLVALLCMVVQGAWATTPSGSFDGCTAIDGGIRVYGWTYDPDAPAESLNIHIYLYDVNISE